MGKVSIDVQKEFCEECSLALRRFIGSKGGKSSMPLCSSDKNSFPITSKG
ncbi:MAG: hypothetical protein HY957_05980 [Nitrospirae bacterium]|nr:hypothetical protein [Nitrospirota bacterium]